MIFPENRYTFSQKKQPKNRNNLFIVIGVIAIIGIALFFIFWKNPRKMNIISSEINPIENIYLLWDQQSYSEIITLTEGLLEKNPMNPQALVFNGFSNFYEGSGKYTLEEKIQYIDKAVTSLRKAMLLKTPPYEKGINYILGKSYYHKGRFYTDLCIKYLEKAVTEGEHGEDIFEYIGLAYSDLENYEKSAEYFIQAAEIRPSDLLYITLSQTYIKLGDNIKAEEYLIRTINRTKDKDLEEKSRFLLAGIYKDRKEYIKAEEQYLRILSFNENSADSHYYLGEIYDTMQDNVKARAEWRMSLKIDPSHYGAKLKLYN